MDLEAQVKRFINTDGLTAEQKKVLSDYDKEAKINLGYSVKTRVDRAFTLAKLAVHTGKPFKEMTAEDVKSFVFSLDVAPITADSYKSHIKKFFKWLYDTDEDPEPTKWIKFRAIKKRKIPEDILTLEEVKALINTADSVRDQAMVAMLYDTAGRLGEVLGLNQKHVKADQYGLFILVDGKTGQRRIRLTVSEPYVRTLLNTHPAKGEDNPLFYTQLGTRMSMPNCRSILKALVKRAGIKKRVHPHLFRHTRLTHLAEDLTEQQLKVFAGWSGDSRMAGVYVHLSGADVDSKILEIAGMKTPDEKKKQDDALKPITCSRCEEVNPSTNRYCSRCAMPLTEDAKDMAEEYKTQLTGELAKGGLETYIQKVIEKKIDETINKMI